MKKAYKRIHFLGIGGISQSALAIILKSKGFFVSGSDRVYSSIIANLEEQSIFVSVGEVSSYLYDADLVVVTAAIKDDDEELKLAKKLNKTIYSRAEMLGEIASWYKNVISIAGSHGKTTTTGMIAKIFIDANKNPTIHVGGELNDINGNVSVGGEDYFITEACEYVDSFLKLKSNTSVILNIQSDHLDYFKTFENLNKSFAKFASKTNKSGLVIYNKDDANTNKYYKVRSLSFSLNNNGVLNAKNIKEHEKGKYGFDCYFLGHKLGKVKLSVYGRHNVYNALSAIAVALEYGIDFDIIKNALCNFKGVKRRFESYGNINGVRVIHDYAHHPTEIKEIIKLAKHLSKGRVFVVFQPHTYSRTKQLLNEFKTCFSEAQEICVFKVYSAREKPCDGINEKELARELLLNGQKAFSFENYDEMKTYLKTKMQENDILLILGAGDIVGFCSFMKL